MSSAQMLGVIVAMSALAFACSPPPRAPAVGPSEPGALTIGFDNRARFPYELERLELWVDGAPLTIDKSLVRRPIALPELARGAHTVLAAATVRYGHGRLCQARVEGEKSFTLGVAPSARLDVVLYDGDVTRPFDERLGIDMVARGLEASRTREPVGFDGCGAARGPCACVAVDCVPRTHRYCSESEPLVTSPRDGF